MILNLAKDCEESIQNADAVLKEHKRIALLHVFMYSSRRINRRMKLAVSLPEWLHCLRKTEIVDRVRNDLRSTNDKILGVSFNEARDEVIGGGQADFDIPWKHLSGDDRALLYAYCNQLGHLEELVAAFQMHFNGAIPDSKPIVVDLGCGPFTGGLAFASTFGDEPRFDYIGIDRSQSMRKLGEQLASAAKNLSGVKRTWKSDVASVEWNTPPGWRPVFIIVSFLLASPTLDVTALMAELDGLLKKFGNGSVTILYTNAIGNEANYSFANFRDALQSQGFTVHADDAGEVQVARLNDTIPRKFRYALFHRPKQTILQLDGG